MTGDSSSEVDAWVVRQRSGRRRRCRIPCDEARPGPPLPWRTRLELANAMFDYLEIFHNHGRRHSALGWLTPIEFENRTSITVA